MTWVYCEPKSRMRIFECVERAAILRATDEFVERCAQRPDRRAIAPTARVFPDPSRRAQTALALLVCCAVRSGLRSRSESARQLRAGLRGASSTYFRKRNRDCNCGLRI